MRKDARYVVLMPAESERVPLDNPAPAASVGDDADARQHRECIRQFRAQVEELLTFLTARRVAGSFGPGDQMYAIQSLVDLQERASLGTVCARPWQPVVPAVGLPQLLLNDLIATLPASRTIAPTELWIARLGAVRDGLIDLERDTD